MDNSPAFYDAIYRKDNRRWDDKKRDQFVGENLLEPKSLLDIGCGSGHTIKHLSTIWPETEFYGIDLSDVAIQLANDRKIPKAKFHTVSDKQTAIPKAEIILLMGVVEHFQNYYALADVRDFMALDGLLYLEIPNCLAYSESKEEGWRKTNGGVAQFEWHLKRETWEEIIKKAGYRTAKSLTGPRASWEFIWVLQRKNTSS